MQARFFDFDAIDGGDVLQLVSATQNALPAWAQSNVQFADSEPNLTPSGLGFGPGVAFMATTTTTTVDMRQAITDPKLAVPKGLQSRKREREELEPPQPREFCFLCAYGDARTTAIPAEDFGTLCDFIRENNGQMAHTELARQTARYYEGFRRRVNENLREGQHPLPPMSERTVLEHIRRHTQDPEVKMVVMMEELQEAREAIVEAMLFEKNLKYGHRRVSKTQIEALEKIMKLEMMVQRTDPSKMFLYSAAARLDTPNLRKGPVAQASRTLINFLRSRSNQ